MSDRGSTTRVGGSPLAVSEGAEVPTRIGRYLLLEVVGSGGMGTVYAAYDPMLDRRVALKVVRPRATAWCDVETARRRLLREAQALASLSHPCVVPVFDVGTFAPEPDAAMPRLAASDHAPPTQPRAHEPETVAHPEPGLSDADASVRDRVADEDVYIAMEFVEGSTLAGWLTRTSDWRAKLDALVLAGRGLVAAHAAGIVHGDFKPGNVLVTDDPQNVRAFDRVLVVDFGLARPASAIAGSASSDASSSGWAREPIDTRTHVLGTPAFMAPEQHRGIVDTAADQFAFCVTAWSALFGRHPFAGPSGSGDAEAPARIRDGHAPAQAPAASEIPVAVARVLRRGLHHDAARRWPSVDAMLRALESAVRPRRAAIALAAVAVAASAGAIAFVVDDSTADCQPPPDGLAGIADPAADARLAARVSADAPAWRHDALAHVVERLHAFGDAWRTEWKTTCADGRATEEARRTAHARRRCLERAEQQARALVEVLAEADDDAWAFGHAAVADLPSPHRCADAKDDAEPDGDPVIDTKVEASIVRARAEQAAGRYARALAAAEEARAIAGASIGLQWEVRLVAADAMSELGKLTEAAAELEAVAWAAPSIARDDLAIDAMIDLVTLHGVERADHATGLQWGQRVAELLARYGPMPGQEAALETGLGLALQSRGDLEASARHLARAVEISEASEHSRLRAATTLSNLGNVLGELGRGPEAIDALRRALDIREELLGPDHPDIAAAANNLGIAVLAEGDTVAARELFERALAIAEAAFGPDNSRLAQYANNLANVAYDRGDLDVARPLYERTLQILQADLGEEHPTTMLAAGNLGLVYRELGRFDDALAVQTDVLARAQRALPAGHANLGMVHNNLAGALWSKGRRTEAREHYERALAIREAALGPDHRLVGTTVHNLGRLAGDESRWKDALAHHGRAFAIWHAAHGPAHPRIGSAHAGLGIALLGLGHVTAARVELSMALALLEGSIDADPLELARARLGLADALARRPAPDRARSRELASAALATMRARPESTGAERKTAETLAQSP